jgi:hypothetical protein
MTTASQSLSHQRAPDPASTPSKSGVSLSAQLSGYASPGLTPKPGSLRRMLASLFWAVLRRRFGYQWQISRQIENEFITERRAAATSPAVPSSRGTGRLETSRIQGEAPTGEVSDFPAVEPCWTPDPASAHAIATEEHWC